MSARTSNRGISSAVSALVIFAGLVIGLGSLYATAGNTTERVGQAVSAQQERVRTVVGTDIHLVDATWKISGGGVLELRINNTGERTLDAAAVDAVIDGVFYSGEDFNRIEVDGRDTRIWRPGEQLLLVRDDHPTTWFNPPNRAKVISGPGVADVRPIESETGGG